jgi:hypothetical protein
MKVLLNQRGRHPVVPVRVSGAAAAAAATAAATAAADQASCHALAVRGCGSGASLVQRKVGVAPPLQVPHVLALLLAAALAADHNIH